MSARPGRGQSNFGCATLLIALLWLALSGPAQAETNTSAKPKRVLVLQAQPVNDLFHSAVASEVVAALPRQTPRIQTYIEGLDAGRLDLWQRPDFLAYMRQKYGPDPFDVIVTIGSAPIQALLTRAPSLVKNRPWVVLLAASRDIAALEDFPNAIIIGDREAFYARNMALLKELRPDLESLLVIGQPPTPLVRASIDDAIQKSRPLYRSIERVEDARDTALIERLRNAPPHTGVYLAGWLQDATGQRLDDREASKAIAAKVVQPVVSSWDFVLGGGVVGGQMVAGAKIGQRAGSVVADLLSGKPTQDFQHFEALGSQLIFDYRALKRHGIPESRLPPGSEVRFRSPSMAQTDPLLFFGTIATIIALAWGLGATVLILRARQSATQKIAANERHFRTLFEANPTVLLVFDADTLRVLASNRKAQQVFGQDRLEPDTTLWALHFVPKGEHVHFQRDVLPSESQRAEQPPVRPLLTHNGQTIRCEIHSHAIDYYGRSARLVAVNDVTLRVQAEDRLADQNDFLNKLLDTIPHPVFWKGADGRYLGANQAFSQLLGHALKDIVGHSVQELTPEGVYQRFIDSDTRLFAQPGTQTFEDRMVFSDGQARDVLVSKATYGHLGAEVMGLVGTIMDISHIKQTEAQLRELNGELEQRVLDRTVDLTRANDELQHAMVQLAQREKMAALGRLVAGVAHELNTPLGNALTVATTLTHQVDQFRDVFAQGTLRRSTMEQFLTEASQACDLLERNTRRAAELVASFKQVAVDQSSMRRRQFELHTLVAETLRTVLAGHRNQAVNIDSHVAQGIVLDSYPGPVEQILTNLIDNALLHAARGRNALHVSIRARMDEADGQLMLSVADDGCGMDHSTASHAFDPFFTTRLGQGGSGLGLYIVYNLVTGVLGGTMCLESTPGAGTRFDLRLPCRAPEH